MNEKDKMDFALERMRYCPESGGFYRETESSWWNVGDRVCELKLRGYKGIEYILGKKRIRIRSHRLGYYAMTGEVPFEIDHIDHNGLNNKWGNLRNVTKSQNIANRRAYGKSGYKGVVITKFGSYIAQITIDGSTRFLGTFDSLMEAADAYDSAAYSLHGEYACLNCQS